MEKILVKADKRPETGKGAARSLRRTGMLPAVVYSDGGSTPIKIQSKQITKLIYSGVGEHALITIELNEDGSKISEHPVLIKDYQRDPVSEEVLHVDFMQVSLEKAVNVTVRLDIIKQPIGVKLGGILQNRLREIEVECLPTSIPDRIEVNAEHIEIGHSLHVSDITVPEGVKIVTDPSEVILLVSAAVVEEAATAEAAPTEPEVVKKGKEEEKQEKKEGEK